VKGLRPFHGKDLVHHLHMSKMSHTDEVTYLRSSTGQNTDWTQVSWKGYGQLRGAWIWQPPSKML